MTPLCLKFKQTACLAYYLIGSSAFGHPQADTRLDQIKKLYVEPLSVKAGTEKLRQDLITQLRKLNAITLVSSRVGADAILSANGEIWVKGYVSLNPRSGRWPSDGTPLYSGFLSVEIKGLDGATLWSYLVTPEAASQDISKNLSKRVAEHLSAALDSDRSASTQRH